MSVLPEPTTKEEIPEEVASSRLTKSHALLLAAVILPLFVNLGAPPLWDGSEPFYAETAREMVETGNWMSLRYDYEPRLEKPPLPVWILAASYKLFGVSEWAARFPIALAAATALMCLCAIGTRLGGAHAGVLAAIATGASFKFFAYARQYAGDVFLMLSFVAALLLFLRWEQSDAAQGGSLRGAWVVLGLSTLIKGPVSLLLIGIGLAYLAMRRRLDLLTRGVIVEGAAILAATVLPWYVAQIVYHGDDFLRVFILRENLARLATTEFGARPVWYYAPALLAGALPSSLLLLLGGADSLCHRLRNVRWPAWLHRASLPALWFGVVFAFFSMARGKREVYLLVAYPAVGLLVGLWTSDAFNRHRGIVLRVSAAIFAAYCLALGASSVLLKNVTGITLAWTLGGFGALGAASIVACAFTRRWRPALAVCAATIGLLHVTAALSLSPLANYRPAPRFAERIRAVRQSSDRVATYRADMPSLMFYARGPVVPLETPEAFAVTLDSASRLFVVMPKSEYDVLASEFRGYTWQVLETLPYLQFKSDQLKQARIGQVGVPHVLVRIESARQER